MMIPMGSEFIRISPRVRAFTVEGMSYWRQREAQIRAKRCNPTGLKRIWLWITRTPIEVSNDEFREMLARSKRV